MEIDAYPGNQQIQQILQAIEKITASKDWDALVVAETELEFILLDKHEWIMYNGLENKSLL